MISCTSVVELGVNVFLSGPRIEWDEEGLEDRLEELPRLEIRTPARPSTNPIPVNKQFV